jgi:hypothetical protein
MKPSAVSCLQGVSDRMAGRDLADSSDWWLDSNVKRMVEAALNLTGTLSFTVRDGETLRMTREQVCAPNRA